VSYNRQFVSYDCKFVSYDRKFVIYNHKFVRYGRKFVSYDRKFVSYNCKFVSYDRKFISYDRKFVSYDRKMFIALAAEDVVSSSLLFLEKQNRQDDFFVSVISSQTIHNDVWPSVHKYSNLSKTLFFQSKLKVFKLAIEIFFLKLWLKYFIMYLISYWQNYLQASR